MQMFLFQALSLSLAIKLIKPAAVFDELSFGKPLNMHLEPILIPPDQEMRNERRISALRDPRYGHYSEVAICFSENYLKRLLLQLHPLHSVLSFQLLLCKIPSSKSCTSL